MGAGGAVEAEFLKLKIRQLEETQAEVMAADKERWLAEHDTYIHTYMYAYMHAHIHAYMQTYIHTFKHTYMHAYIHTYIHTYILTYIHRCWQRRSSGGWPSTVTRRACGRRSKWRCVPSASPPRCWLVISN